MPPLPISFVLYASTKGHYGRKGDWRLTLDHWDRQIPLAAFGERIAHLKVSPDEGSLGADMALELRARGFRVLVTNAGWSRGLVHQGAYMADCVTVSKERTLYKQPYYLHVEDDSVICSSIPLEDLLLRACQMLADDHEMLTARVARKGDDRGPTVTPPTVDSRCYWSEHVNLQPLLMRSLDFYRLALMLEANPQACETVQCEALWAAILRGFSRSPYKHLVWELDHAHTVHLGVPQPEHEAALKTLSL